MDIIWSQKNEIFADFRLRSAKITFSFKQFLSHFVAFSSYTCCLITWLIIVDLIWCLSSGGAAARVSASHQCGPVSCPRSCIIRGLLVLLVLVLYALSNFLRDLQVSSLHRNQQF